MKSSTPMKRHFPLTPDQVLGPYYIANAPSRQKMFPAGATGELINVKGQILSEEGLSINGAVLDVWLADPNGRYDNQDVDGNPITVAKTKQVYRGQIIAANDGSYSFSCLRPGNYFDEGWSLWRPAHIHLRVSDSRYKTLVTQLYFQDDAHNTNDIPKDGFFKPELALSLSPATASARATQSAIFNIVLQAANKK